jgi:hypothetical protein
MKSLRIERLGELLPATDELILKNRWLLSGVGIGLFLCGPRHFEFF